MWFCEMRQMPQLRDCAYELTSQMLRRCRDLFTSLEGRWAARRSDQGRVEVIAPLTAARPRLVGRAWPGA